MGRERKKNIESKLDPTRIKVGNRALYTGQKYEAAPRKSLWDNKK